MKRSIRKIIDEELLFLNKNIKTFDDISQYNKRKNTNYIKLILYLNEI